VSDIPPRVRPEDFDALTAAMERCEATAIRVAKTRRQLKLDESKEMAALRAENATLKSRIRMALKWLDVAQQKVNDNPTNGPGAPSVPGLFELRNGLAALRPTSTRTGQPRSRR
jgi:hypothetical protein